MQNEVEFYWSRLSESVFKSQESMPLREIRCTHARKQQVFPSTRLGIKKQLSRMFSFLQLPKSQETTKNIDSNKQNNNRSISSVLTNLQKIEKQKKSGSVSSNVFESFTSKKTKMEVQVGIDKMHDYKVEEDGDRDADEQEENEEELGEEQVYDDNFDEVDHNEEKEKLKFFIVKNVNFFFGINVVMLPFS